MNALSTTAEFAAGATVAATRPTPVFGLSRKQLARWAFDQAYAKLDADSRAGRIPADKALLKYRALSAAYQKRKQDLDLASFLGPRGLGSILNNEAL